VRQKLLFITPHLSTGGAPQYLLKKIERLNSVFKIYCIEYSDISHGAFVVQSDKIKTILGERLISLADDKVTILNHIKKIEPDIIHLEELPELFMNSSVAKKIYELPRSYKLIETSHNSSIDPTDKKFFPDKFIFVSEYQKNLFSRLDIPSSVVEYPIEYRDRPDRSSSLSELNLDPGIKHFLHVGLFTSRKNQAEAMEYAKYLLDYPVQFHFVGNQADNFKSYWEPLIENLPSNCKVWGERKDVDSFYSSMDCFLFTSKGEDGDRETSPLVIREAIGWGMPILIYNLDVYCGMYDKYPNVNYLSDFKSNLKLIVDYKRGLKKTTVKGDIEARFESGKLLINNNGPHADLLISVKDYHTNIPIYWTTLNMPSNTEWFVDPVGGKDFLKESFFSSFLLEFYNLEKVKLFNHIVEVKPFTHIPVKVDYEFPPFDCLYLNYKEMFYDDIYSKFDLDNLKTCIDVGANVGLFSLYLLNRNCRNIHSLEPCESSFSVLNSLFKETNNVECHKIALYKKNGKVNLNTSIANTTISTVLENYNTKSNKYGSKENVACLTLASFLKSNSIESLDLVKLDIEGCEYDVLKNTDDETLLKSKRYLIEYHELGKVKMGFILNKFKKLGYELSNAHDPNYEKDFGTFFAQIK